MFSPVKAEGVLSSKLQYLYDCVLSDQLCGFRRLSMRWTDCHASVCLHCVSTTDTRVRKFCLFLNALSVMRSATDGCVLHATAPHPKINISLPIFCFITGAKSSARGFQSCNSVTLITSALSRVIHCSNTVCLCQVPSLYFLFPLLSLSKARLFAPPCLSYSTTGESSTYMEFYWNL